MRGGGQTRRSFIRRSGIATAGIGTLGLAGTATAAGDLEALETNPWTGRRILNIAHRGGAFEAPENTLFAFKRAFAIGAHAIEFDVWETRDGVPVVHHDETVDRQTNGSGSIEDYTLEELKQLDGAYWFAPDMGTCNPDDPDDRACPDDPDEGDFPYRGIATGERDIPDEFGEEYGLTDLEPNDFRIPTVEEVLDAFPEEYLVIELKTDGFESSIVSLLEAYGRSDDVIVASFSQGPLSTVRDEAPDVPTSGSTWETGGFILWSVSWFPTPDLWFEMLPLPYEYEGIPVFSEGVVDDARDANLAAHAWTIDERSKMEEVVDAGVDGIYTDRPTVLADVLEETGTGYDGEPDDGEDDGDQEGGSGPGFTLPVVGAAVGGAALAKRLRSRSDSVGESEIDR